MHILFENLKICNLKILYLFCAYLSVLKKQKKKFIHLYHFSTEILIYLV